ncbi:MAG: response regulator [bacterium]|nr:response regulator [bacterium]
METKIYNILIIDDHPLIAQAYNLALLELKNKEDVDFIVEICHNCTDGYKAIKDTVSDKKSIDLVFLDISLPPSKDGKILSGEDLGIKFRELLPAAKIIVSTTYSDNYRIHNIIKSVNPEGFLIKNDLDPDELLKAIVAVLDGKLYFTESVLEVLRNNVSSDFVLDSTDRRILYELSIGTKMKDIPNVLPLSIAGIEKRKRNLKVIFNIKKNSDKDLIQLAKKKGFI